jgi:hypothetical protein
MSAEIVPFVVLELRRAERRRAMTLQEISALQSNMAEIGGALGRTRDSLTHAQIELDLAVTRLSYAQIFSKRCQEIMDSTDPAAMITMRESLLRSPLADHVLTLEARSHQQALGEAMSF